MIRFGLVCLFRNEPIKFKQTTAAHLAKFSRQEQIEKLETLCFHNAKSLLQALNYCNNNGIGSFRVNSQILPLKTHPQVGYEISDLPNGQEIIHQFELCGEFAHKNDIRTLFHPDQFVVLSSPHEKVVENSIRELEYQTEVAQWIHADVVNVHAGGKYDSKEKALQRFSANFQRLSKAAKQRLTIENDDMIYTPTDLIPLCQELSIPLVYDVHHHRCLQDDLSIEEATDKAFSTWNREPILHISSPKYGRLEKNCRSHHDFIDIKDFPEYWLDLQFTLEVEAKAKETAVLKLKEDLEKIR